MEKASLGKARLFKFLEERGKLAKPKDESDAELDLLADADDLELDEEDLADILKTEDEVELPSANAPSKGFAAALRKHL